MRERGRGAQRANTVFVSADPFASLAGVRVGRPEVEESLRVAELYDFIEPETKLQNRCAGTVELFAVFTVKNGRPNGGVKPRLVNVDVWSRRVGGVGIASKAGSWTCAVKIGIAFGSRP